MNVRRKASREKEVDKSQLPANDAFRQVIAYVTARDMMEAKRIGETVVREKLAACANIIPAIESVYWWKGKVQRDKESILLLKTKKLLASKLVKRVKALHSYEIPCVDIIPVTQGNKDYFKWIEDVTK